MPPELMADGPESTPDPPSSSSSSSSSSSEVSFETDSLPVVKCVVVGSEATGKTSLVVSYSANEQPRQYAPTTYDNYTVTVRVDEKPMRLQLCDTSGQEQNDFSVLRTLSYSDADVFVVCFNVVCLTSFADVAAKWIPEIRHHRPLAPIVLVGTQSDRRDPAAAADEALSGGRQRPRRPVIADGDGRRLAEDVGASAYVECSAATRRGVKEVFDTAIFAALDQRGFVTKCRMASIRRSNKYRCRSELWTGAGGSGRGSNSVNNKYKKSWKQLCCFMS